MGEFNLVKIVDSLKAIIEDIDDVGDVHIGQVRGLSPGDVYMLLEEIAIEHEPNSMRGIFTYSIFWLLDQQDPDEAEEAVRVVVPRVINAFALATQARSTIKDGYLRILAARPDFLYLDSSLYRIIDFSLEVRERIPFNYGP